MKNILILGSGRVAHQFIAWVSKNRVAENEYYATVYKQSSIQAKIGQNVTVIDADPTSFLRLKYIMEETTFSNIFVILEEIEEARDVLKNIALINNKIRVVLVNVWSDIAIGQNQEEVTVIHTDRLIASHLYDQLPNVPLIAQNVGLGHGEIMEVHIPLGSAYAYRHIGSIKQHRWKIAAVYRREKQILPTSDTMIRPNDTLLIVGRPIVLNNVYKMVNKRTGRFPEPFGKNIYLILDFRYDQKEALLYLHQSLYLLETLEEKCLVIRILYPNNFKLIRQLKAFESDNVSIYICYIDKDAKMLVEHDIEEHNIGLVMNSVDAFKADELKELIYDLKKLVFIFGDTLLYNIKRSIVLMKDDDKMESISSTAFDMTEMLGLELKLCDFDPEGIFENRKMIISHYETLAQIFNMELKMEQKMVNPIRELFLQEDILQITPFDKDLNTSLWKKFISHKIEDFILTTKNHPKVLVPFSLFET